MGLAIQGNPEEIWGKTKDYSATTQKKLFDYFKNKKDVYAIEIKDLQIFNPPLNPYDICPYFVPPQSFIYLE